MQPLFTLHAGEYLVGAHIEHHFKRTNVWVPVRDTGVDLLVSDPRNRATVSLQVKYSKDFLVTHMRTAFHLEADFQRRLRACGWWSIDRDKLARSPADYWVFVLQGFASRSTDFVVIPRVRLLAALTAIHGQRKTIQTYIWVTEDDRCWETRGLERPDQLLVARGGYQRRDRDLTRWLNNWAPIARLNK
jgi:hypothetical protein